ncbi:MAG: DUF805 domain-containing protein [Burkholderiaceae bacterium]
MSMGIQQAFVTCLKKYADFSGRATRSEYWWFVLCEVLILGIASLISDWLPGLFALALVLPALAVGARRLHDTGRSGWWLLLMLVPFIGGLFLLYWAVLPSQPSANAFGEPAA